VTPSKETYSAMQASTLAEHKWSGFAIVGVLGHTEAGGIPITH